MDEPIAAAAYRLSESLHDRGLKCSVGYNKGAAVEPALVVYCERKSDVKKLPPRYDGYPVRGEYSGKIRPANKD